MSKVNDGGPFHPIGSADDFPNNECGHPGLSLRDYFIAHAPAQPTFEFVVRMPTERPEPILPDKGEWPANATEIKVWDDERELQRMIQWPCVWADAMLAQRQKPSE